MNRIAARTDFRNFLSLFSRKFWFAPSDVLLRATEAVIWSKQKLKSPILDIGCGDGRISKLLLANFGKIDVGLDLNSEEVDRARQSGAYKKVVTADAVKMPFGEESFQTIISNSTFEHIKSDLQAVEEVSRILKKDGLFLFTVPTKRLRKVFKNIMNQNQFKNLNQRVDHFHYRSLKEWEKILNNSKLKIVHNQYYFPEKAVRVWYRLFRIATFKPYRRELWSYLKDSPYGKLAPKKLITFLLEKYLDRFYKDMFTEKGCWLFIIAQKKK